MDYIKKTIFIWVLFIVCIYCILACEFESLRMAIFSINEDIIVVEKINDIIKNLSFSYVAGVIFFFLSDTIPFQRRKKFVNKNVNRSLNLIYNAIDDFSQSINNKKWDETIDPKSIYEDIFGGEYPEQEYKQKLPLNIISDMLKFANTINPYIDFIISQELYVNSKLVKNLEDIKLFDGMRYISSLSVDTNNIISSEELVSVFRDIIKIRSIILKHL